MKIVIVIPTYNEAANIKPLLQKLLEQFSKQSNHEYSILVVDANSIDGTQNEVNSLSQIHSNIHLLNEGKKSGLGAAYIKGFDYAVKNLGAEVLVEMDADFQHPPEGVIRLISEIDNGYDYVIGSRFIKGGSIPKDWAFYRKFLSYGGNIFAKMVLGIFDVNDFTSGFKASRVRGFVDRIDFNSIISSGFAYKIDLLYKMHNLGAKLKEIPINFGLRDRGDSKMEKNNFIDSLMVVLMLRVKHSYSFFKFTGVGFLGLLVDLGLFNTLRILTGMSAVSALVSGSLALLTTYIFNNLWSFGDRKIDGFSKHFKSFIVYTCFSIIPIVIRARLIHYAILYFVDTFFIANIAFFVGILFGLVWNYTVYSKIIWRKNQNA